MLAAMEEHTSLPFRLIAKELGAHLVFTEVQPDRLVKGERLAQKFPATGADEKITAEAAALVAERGFDLVDVNVSCPIKRVVDRGWSVPRRSPRVAALVRACVAATGSVPVTVKMRKGFAEARPNAPEVAAKVAEAGEGRPGRADGAGAGEGVEGSFPGEVRLGLTGSIHQK